MIDATRSTHNQEIVDSYVNGYNKGKLDSKIEFIENACKWLDKNKHFHKELSFGGVSTDWDKFIRAFRKDMEELL